VNAATGTAEKTLYFIGGAPQANRTGSDELNSGVYRVVFTLIKDSNTQTVTWRDAVHVYQNMTSVFSYEFIEAHFNNIKYTVRFVYNDGATPDLLADRLHGQTVQAPASPPRTDYDFDDWYTDNSFRDKWDFNTVLTGDITLYANWISNPFTFISVTANGNVTQTTTQLTLTFDRAIPGLSAEDITLTGITGVSKEEDLSGSGPTYTLPISGFTTGGILSVSVAKSGINISGSPKSVIIFYPNVFTSIADMTAWLSARPDNTPATAYDVKLNVNDLTSISNNTFSNKFVNLDLSGSTITSIGNINFQSCTSLTSIAIPNSVTNIGVGAFASCTKLTNVTIPNSVTSIGEQAFSRCDSLTSITIPNIRETTRFT